MAYYQISVKTVNGDSLKGLFWPVENPVASVIIVPGMEEHALRYDDFATFLNSHGCVVTCIDHYGQGLNSHDGKLGIVPPSFFSKTVRNIDDLVKRSRKNNLPIIVLGHSMGSFMVQDYIQRFSGHADKIILSGSDGPNHNSRNKMGYKIAKLTCTNKSQFKKSKLMKSLSFGSYNKSIKNPRTEFDWLTHDNTIVDKYVADPLCGYGSSKIFYREFLKGNARLYKDKFLNKISKDSRILIVSGDEDPVGAYGKGPRALEKMYKGLGIKDVELILYPNMRHEVLNEIDRQKVYQDILNFIKK